MRIILLCLCKFKPLSFCFKSYFSAYWQLVSLNGQNASSWYWRMGEIYIQVLVWVILYHINYSSKHKGLPIYAKRGNSKPQSWAENIGWCICCIGSQRNRLVGVFKDITGLVIKQLYVLCVKPVLENSGARGSRKPIGINPVQNLVLRRGQGLKKLEIFLDLDLSALLNSKKVIEAVTKFLDSLVHLLNWWLGWHHSVSRFCQFAFPLRHQIVVVISKNPLDTQAKFV